MVKFLYLSRSGSCPSQLLQNIPMDVINQANQGTGPFVYGSQRIKGHKERPSMAQYVFNVVSCLDLNLTKIFPFQSPN